MRPAIGKVYKLSGPRPKPMKLVKDIVRKPRSETVYFAAVHGGVVSRALDHSTVAWFEERIVEGPLELQPLLEAQRVTQDRSI